MGFPGRDHRHGTILFEKKGGREIFFERGEDFFQKILKKGEDIFKTKIKLSLFLLLKKVISEVKK